MNDERSRLAMDWRVSLVARMFGFVCLSGMTIGMARGEDPVLERFQQAIEPVLVERCHGCHANGINKGNVALDGFETTAALRKDPGLWWRVLKNVRAGVMPPREHERLRADELESLAVWIKRDVFELDALDPDPGRVTIRRLNRTEYRNTIRDLMGIEFRTEEEFPPDDTGYGFDTIGDVLTVSPLLLEKYLAAAEVIVSQAVPTVSKRVRERAIVGRADRGRENRREAPVFSFYKPGKLSRKYEAEREGTYRVRMEIETRGGFEFDPGRAKLGILIDGAEVFREEMGWASGERRTLEMERSLGSGEHSIDVSIEPLVPEEKKKHPLDVAILRVVVEGPLEREHWVHPPNYERFFTREEAPEDLAEREAYAREVLDRFALRAFRRPVDGSTVERFSRLALATSAETGVTFEAGIARAMVAILASPRFQFRVEREAPATIDQRFPLIDEYSLASRLSYFLWSTMPDDELFAVAGRGELRANLGAQVDRMLRSERSRALVENFVGQWLQARDIEGVSINARAVMARERAPVRTGEAAGERPRPRPPFVELDRDLRVAMRQETEMTFGYVVRENRSLLELIDSDYTFLNERLAKHYGIGEVTGEEMRLVNLPAGSPRGGVLTQGTVLAVTSNPTRTSPVKRGLFVLDNILGTPAPPPPADVPTLEDAEKERQGAPPTMRELMEIHRSKPLCASCHSRMDPLGLALENFNALGMFRESERGQAIDSSGELFTGERFTGVGELKRVLKESRRGDFYRCVTEKLLTYALGRGVEYHDAETVDGIVERVSRSEGRASELLMGVIESAAFQRRRRGQIEEKAALNSREPTLIEVAKP